MANIPILLSGVILFADSYKGLLLLAIDLVPSRDLYKIQFSSQEAIICVKDNLYFLPVSLMVLSPKSLYTTFIQAGGK